MERDTMAGSFERLGIPPHDYCVLKLLPLIYVAWADGKMERVKKERIEYYAAGEYDLSPAGAAVLTGWLTKRPTHAYIAEGLHDIYSLALADSDIEVNFSELPALLSYAEAIARSTLLRVRSSTDGSLLMTRETVLSDTRECLATSLIVGLRIPGVSLVRWGWADSAWNWPSAPAAVALVT